MTLEKVAVTTLALKIAVNSALGTHQVMFERKGLAALGALERALSSVQQEVRAEAVFERKALPALGTDVRALARVHTHVRAQVMLHQERLAALLARVRPLLRQTDGRFLHHAQQAGLLLLL